METKYLELHERYRLRAQASLYQGANSPGYVANWQILKALETSDPAKFIANALNKARIEAEGSQGTPKLNQFWEIQVRLFREAITAVRKVDSKG